MYVCVHVCEVYYIYIIIIITCKRLQFTYITFAILTSHHWLLNPLLNDFQGCQLAVGRLSLQIIDQQKMFNEPMSITNCIIFTQSKRAVVEAPILTLVLTAILVVHNSDMYNHTEAKIPIILPGKQVKESSI